MDRNTHQPRSGDSMPGVHPLGTYTKLTYHVVFSTKYRRRTIVESFRERLYEYIGGIVRNLNGSLLEIGGIEDHIHMLVNLSPAKLVSDAIRDIKSNSSKWLNELQHVRRHFEWQKGYGAFTVSHSQIDGVRDYIQSQKEHHRKMTFEEEYIKMLERHGIEFERKYLFEAEHNG
jgi:REP element-mobilizing transposase RayT